MAIRNEQKRGWCPGLQANKRPRHQPRPHRAARKKKKVAQKTQQTLFSCLGRNQIQPSTLFTDGYLFLLIFCFSYADFSVAHVTQICNSTRSAAGVWRQTRRKQPFVYCWKWNDVRFERCSSISSRCHKTALLDYGYENCRFFLSHPLRDKIEPHFTFQLCSLLLGGVKSIYIAAVL